MEIPDRYFCEMIWITGIRIAAGNRFYEPDDHI